MDPAEAFSTGLFKWGVPRGTMPLPPALNRQLEGVVTTLPQPPHSLWASSRELGHGSLEDLFQTYGIRYYTAEKIAETGFTITTLLHMKDEEIDDMMNRLSRIFRWDLLVGERYGVKAAIRAERRRLEEEEESRRLHYFLDTNTLDALSQQGGLSEEPVQPQGGGVIVGGGTTRAPPLTTGKKKRLIKKKGRGGKVEDAGDESDGRSEDDENENGGGSGRQREHPFIVTEPGEVAREKKNGLDYLFHLYEQCREFLIQVQTIAKEKGEKCPTKVTNQVFRYAKKAGANYINKPKMRHYVHCYALHCLDEETSNALRRAFKERHENVGAWRLACYKPLVYITARKGWDIDSIFNAHPRLSIWYVPTKLCLLCHGEKTNNASFSSTS